MEPRFPKKEWGEGPWQEESDRLEWEYKGFPCLMRRNMEITGSWCGYVAVPPGHPAFEKGYDDVEVDVHGGLTYANHCQGPICHVPAPGEPDNVWWLGFDCAHGFDLSPRLEAFTQQIMGHKSFLGVHQHYWTAKEVRREVKSLADQLAALQEPSTIAPGER